MNIPNSNSAARWYTVCPTLSVPLTDYNVTQEKKLLLYLQYLNAFKSNHINHAMPSDIDQNKLKKGRECRNN